MDKRDKLITAHSDKGKFLFKDEFRAKEKQKLSEHSPTYSNGCVLEFTSRITLTLRKQACEIVLVDTEIPNIAMKKKV